MKKSTHPTRPISESPPRSFEGPSPPERSALLRGRDRVDAARPIRILVAEDDDEMRRLLTWCLLEHGYEVVEATDGTELCRKLAPQLAHPDAARFDLVISDVRMPGTTGLQVLEGLQALAELPPMILITAFGDGETHRKVRDLGSAILDKPFEIDDLLDLVSRTLAGLSPVERTELAGPGPIFDHGEESSHVRK